MPVSVRCLAAACLWWVSGFAVAQAVTILGSNDDARSCYAAATLAVQAAVAPASSSDSCDRALREPTLDKADRVATLVNRGVLRTVLGELQGAAEDYRLALALDDSRPEIYVNRGNLWFRAGHFEQAIADYDHALELDFARAHIIYLNRGMAYESLGQLARAQQDYLDALALIPEWPPALKKLERVRRRLTPL